MKFNLRALSIVIPCSLLLACGGKKTSGLGGGSATDATESKNQFKGSTNFSKATKSVMALRRGNQIEIYFLSQAGIDCDSKPTKQQLATWDILVFGAPAKVGTYTNKNGAGGAYGKWGALKAIAQSQVLISAINDDEVSGKIDAQDTAGSVSGPFRADICSKTTSR